MNKELLLEVRCHVGPFSWGGQHAGDQASLA
jgi:hypothetical protein